MKRVNLVLLIIIFLDKVGNINRFYLNLINKFFNIIMNVNLFILI